MQGARCVTMLSSAGTGGPVGVQVRDPGGAG